jgi:2-C-methyl-D-erythritol 4-phosphate cytidylyltransferase
VWRSIAIVVAAGAGERLGGSMPKALVPLAGVPMLVRSARAASTAHGVDAVVVAAPAGYEDLAHAMLEPVGTHSVVTGGDSRQASVRAALAALPAEVPFVVVHDAARPLATPELFTAVLGALDGSPDVDGAVPVLPIPDTVKRVRDGFVIGTEDRAALRLAQTPQAFRADALRRSHALAAGEGVLFTDDAALLEWAGRRVTTVPGEQDNLKITTPEDLARAVHLLEERVRD